MSFVAAKCCDDSNSFIMAENAGRSLKLHIQQYFIRSYLKAFKNNLRKGFYIFGKCCFLAESQMRRYHSLSVLSLKLKATASSQLA